MADKEYIEREAALDVCKTHYQHCLMMHDYSGDTTADQIKTDIETIPAADVVEVVRCKDCRHFTAGYCCRDIKGRSQMHYMGENAFCSYGAKMDRKGEGE